MTTAANSAVAHVVATSGSMTPVSFNGDGTLFLFNLVLMTAAGFLGLMMVGKQLRRIIARRGVDRAKDPVTVHRWILVLFATAMTVGRGASAMTLWAWDPADAAFTARILMLQRWLDPVAIACGLTAMALVLLAEPGIEKQLQNRPLPVKMWSRWPALIRPAGVVLTIFAASLAAVMLR